MTKNDAARLLPIIKALAEGKTIQCRFQNHACDPDWRDCNDPQLTPDSGLQFRIKPEPQLRAWTLKEMPIGAIIRRKDTHATNIPQLVIAADLISSSTSVPEVPYAVVKFDPRENVTAEALLARWEWQYPGGTAWFPCGIEVPE